MKMQWTMGNPVSVVSGWHYHYCKLLAWSKHVIRTMTHWPLVADHGSPALLALSRHYCELFVLMENNILVMVVGERELSDLLAASQPQPISMFRLYLFILVPQAKDLTLTNPRTVKRKKLDLTECSGNLSDTCSACFVNHAFFSLWIV